MTNIWYPESREEQVVYHSLSPFQEQPSTWSVEERTSLVLIAAKHRKGSKCYSLNGWGGLLSALTLCGLAGALSASRGVTSWDIGKARDTKATVRGEVAELSKAIYKPAGQFTVLSVDGCYLPKAGDIEVEASSQA
ncbi:hypothetical protein BDY19DRAFT_910562 [Irpex rosettiformis]|uniref:Uncharacterized protein n=1 Tax=Irpex rosettiformis TaxID=378272 RepID=A0ACB8TND5_9APHY|nr:hypothetical protein BDY19DRAFT_910562 [Irpex rosettiformis]